MNPKDPDSELDEILQRFWVTATSSTIRSPYRHARYTAVEEILAWHSKLVSGEQGSSQGAEALKAVGHEADNRYAHAKITGSTGIRVNVFADDTELDKALRLLRAATDRVDEAVIGLVGDKPLADDGTANKPTPAQQEEK